MNYILTSNQAGVQTIFCFRKKNKNIANIFHVEKIRREREAKIEREKDLVISKLNRGSDGDT